jgi:predicted amidohydrolase YtcJ
MPTTKLLVPIAAAFLAAAGASAQDADLLLVNGRIWTADEAQPWAEAVAVRGDRVAAVGTSAQLASWRGAETRVIDLGGRLTTPGFIDNHTHFEQAGSLLLGINLLDVADADGLIERVRGARDRLPSDAWIVGGNWGAYEEWELGAAGADQAARPGERFRPTRVLIDSITPGSGVLINRWDRSAFLANAVALEAAGLSCAAPVEGLECVGGTATGIVDGEALRRVREAIPEKSFEQRLREAHLALTDLARFGVTGIHDNTPAAQMRVFQALRDAGELTTRVYARPTLDRWRELAAVGIRHGFGDDYLRIGGLKGFVDGIMGASTAMFYEPFLHTGGFGIWRDMMSAPGGMQGLIIDADAAGHWPQIHAIGDLAIDTLVTMYEEAIRANGPRADRRFRVIHTQHIRGPEVAARMARSGIIAEVQPYHAIDDMRWMAERIGPERIRYTYAFRTLDDAGVLLSFGSDWPGTQASWYPADPLLGIYAAVTRQTLEGEPAGGWVPEERVDVETALRAYTVNNAYAAGEEAVKGSISVGKLADFAVVDRDILAIPPAEIRDARVLMTILGGRIVYETEELAASR